MLYLPVSYQQNLPLKNTKEERNTHG